MVLVPLFSLIFLSFLFAYFFFLPLVFAVSSLFFTVSFFNLCFCLVRSYIYYISFG